MSHPTPTQHLHHQGAAAGIPYAPNWHQRGTAQGFPTSISFCSSVVFLMGSAASQEVGEQEGTRGIPPTASHQLPKDGNGVRGASRDQWARPCCDFMHITRTSPTLAPVVSQKATAPTHNLGRTSSAAGPSGQERCPLHCTASSILPLKSPRLLLLKDMGFKSSRILFLCPQYLEVTLLLYIQQPGSPHHLSSAGEDADARS